MAHLPILRDKKRVIETGEFEFETYVSKKELINFLKNLIEQMEHGNEVTISSDEWEINFNFTEPVEVEIELNSDERKLEIEIEFRQRSKIQSG